MTENAEAKAEPQPEKRPHKYRKKILLTLPLLFVVGLAALGYSPIRTLASLEKVNDHPLYVMRYHGEYSIDLVAEKGMEWGPFQKLYRQINPDACTSFAAPSQEGRSLEAARGGTEGAPGHVPMAVMVAPTFELEDGYGPPRILTRVRICTATIGVVK